MSKFNERASDQWSKEQEVQLQLFVVLDSLFGLKV